MNESRPMTAKGKTMKTKRKGEPSPMRQIRAVVRYRVTILGLPILADFAGWQVLSGDSVCTYTYDHEGD